MVVPTHEVCQGGEHIAIIDNYGNISEFANPAAPDKRRRSVGDECVGAAARDVLAPPSPRLKEQ
jgi:hypothetical protein